MLPHAASHVPAVFISTQPACVAVESPTSSGQLPVISVTPLHVSAPIHRDTSGGVPWLVSSVSAAQALTSRLSALVLCTRLPESVTTIATPAHLPLSACDPGSTVVAPPISCAHCPIVQLTSAPVSILYAVPSCSPAASHMCMSWHAVEHAVLNLILIMYVLSTIADLMKLMCISFLTCTPELCVDGLRPNLQSCLCLLHDLWFTVMLIPFLCSPAYLVLTPMPSLCRVASPQHRSKHRRPPLFFLSSACSAAHSSGGGKYRYVVCLC